MVSATEWLSTLKTNRQEYEVAYAYIYYFVPYWITRSAMKWNKHMEMEDLWRYWIHLFIAAKKRNYSVLFIRFLWILKSLHPEIRAALNHSLVLSFTGMEGSEIPIDGFNELVNI